MSEWEDSKELRDKFLSLFKIAGIDINKTWDIRNGYSGSKPDWLLVHTPYGLMTIGWRKRVIEIEWSGTHMEYIVKDDVTKDKYMCHAWGYPKAVEYMTDLKARFIGKAH